MPVLVLEGFAQMQVCDGVPLPCRITRSTGPSFLEWLGATHCIAVAPG